MHTCREFRPDAITVRSALRLPIAAKFAAILAVLVAALLAVGFAGLGGLSNLHANIKSLYGDHVLTLEHASALATDSGRAEKIALQIIVSNNEPEIARLEDQLGTVVIPSVDADINGLRTLSASDLAPEREKIEQVAGWWAKFVALRTGTPLDSAQEGAATVRHDNALAGRIRRMFAPIERAAAEQTRLESSQAAALAAKAQGTYAGSRRLVALIAIVAIIIGAAVVALLIRTIVSRIRRYSNFALRVAAGYAADSVRVSGHDELSELGVALNEMVKRRVLERRREDLQSEFTEVMGLTETEQEAHGLLKHQIERLVPASSVVMLNRNNSADRLQATTEVPEDSPLSITLADAKPRSCLAVRFARTHTESVDASSLISCEVCGKVADFSTCEPLLVGGEVIGAVLASHPGPLADADAHSITQSVAQAAPVLANLRNLAIAELRAKTDALTGLPNNRNVTDTVRRMVAHASRSVSPLAALALDLDHFKQVNDTYGHGSGDEVLAAVGSTLNDACRASDFVGRAGGEEFLILLPDTGLEAAQLVAEKVRLAIAAMAIPSVDRPITASIGVAILPDHAGDATSLLRHADRALYAAKKGGRNRVETFTRGMLAGDSAVLETSQTVLGMSGPVASDVLAEG
jgi:diguanylate cyclase (GGDEF)-like protein